MPIVTEKAKCLAILERRIKDYDAASKMHGDNGNLVAQSRCDLRAYSLREVVAEIKANV